jgi:hypothetical protein
MKTKNQTEQSLLELAIEKAANEDGLNPASVREVAPVVRKQAWSPKEVWFTRVRAVSKFTRSEPAQV